MSDNENNEEIPELANPAETQVDNSSAPLVWQASEYIHHEKDFSWYAIFGVSSVVVMLLMYLITRDIWSLLVIGLMVITVIVYANRPPRVLQYGVSDEGIQIGERNYGYETFKSFSIVQEGAIESIILNPLQRFMPPITVYFEPEQGQKIVDILSHYLPLREFEPDIIDRFASRIRF
jgi:hypothetical protein